MAATPPAAALLMDQFLGWVAARPRSHAETMEAWRSACPRLSIWEDALADGLVRVGRDRGALVVRLTPDGALRIGGDRAGGAACPSAEDPQASDH